METKKIIELKDKAEKFCDKSPTFTRKDKSMESIARSSCAIGVYKLSGYLLEEEQK